MLRPYSFASTWLPQRPRTIGQKRSMLRPYSFASTHS
jgi:hypothetical protein